MKNFLVIVLAVFLTAVFTGGAFAMDKNTVVLETTQGIIELKLSPDVAPKACENFKGLVEKGYYNGTIFHRVIPGFVVQGGGMLPGLKEKDPRAPIVNEASKAPPNARGTLAMARTSDPDSATSQFYINLSDNKSLNHTGRGPGGAGYCAFAKVVEGMDIVDKIAAVPTGRRSPHSDVPLQDIVLSKATVAT